MKRETNNLQSQKVQRSDGESSKNYEFKEETEELQEIYEYKKETEGVQEIEEFKDCLLYTSPSPRDS